MKKLLARLILWAIGERFNVLSEERCAILNRTWMLDSTWDTHQRIHDDISGRLSDHSGRLKQQAEALAACASEIQELRIKLAEQPAEPPRTIRRAANHGEFRIAAEAAARKRK